MKVTALVLGLIAATLMLIGGCAGFVFGAAAVSFEESFDVERRAEGAVSTSEDVQEAGRFAIIVAVIAYVGAGISMVAQRTSLTILAICFLLSIWLVTVDTTSLFAAFYYGCILIFGVCVVLIFLDLKRSRRVDTGPYVPR